MRWRQPVPLALCCAHFAHSQTPASQQAASEQLRRPAIASAIFHSDLLHLSLTYPGSLVAEKVASPDEQHAAIASKQAPDEKPDYKKADQCTDKVLSAHRSDDPEKDRATIEIYGDSRGTAIHFEPVVDASIMIARVGLECVPAEYRGQADAMAAVMAEGFVQRSGLKEIDQPIWYEIGKERIHFVAAESTPDAKESDGTASASKPRMWVASIAFAWEDNLITIQIESNDLPFFNEMLHSSIAFGNEPAAPLFSADIGNGKPIQPKP